MQPGYINRSFLYCLAAALLLANTGCKKFLEPDYKTQVTTAVVFANDNNAMGALNGLYSSISNSSSFNGEITRLAGLGSDELKYYTSSQNFDQFSTDQILPQNSSVAGIWSDAYNAIYQCNSLIENSAASTGMSDAFKKQVVGEAKFFRAFFNFYLVNFFGPVPLLATTDKNVTAYTARNTVDEIYTQVITDLKDAYNALPADYSVSGSNRTRVNKWGAAALLARVDLYTNDYVNAEAQASAVLANTSLYSLLSDQNTVFLMNQGESILEWDRTSSFNTYEASVFLTYPLVYGLPANHIILPGLLNSFETGDSRKTNWTKTFGSAAVPYKYKALSSGVKTENYLLLRVAEQYLIRAEARAQQNNISGAQADINIIRNRSGLANDATMTDKTTAMAAIENERRHELFCEWGHRWFDLKRWPSLTTPGKTRADDVLGALKTTWKSSAVLYPIPLSAITNNPNLTQNAGY